MVDLALADNFVGAFAAGQVLQVLVIAVLSGFALLALKHERRAVVEDGLNRVSTCRCARGYARAPGAAL